MKKIKDNFIDYINSRIKFYASFDLNLFHSVLRPIDFLSELKKLKEVYKNAKTDD